MESNPGGANVCWDMLIIFMSLASEHPQAEVIGTDVSPIQPNWYVEAILICSSDSVILDGPNIIAGVKCSHVLGFPPMSNLR